MTLFFKEEERMVLQRLLTLQSSK